MFLFALVVWLAPAAAQPPSAQAVALTLTGIVTVSSPLWLQKLPWTGAQMTAASYLAALGISILSSWIAGDLTIDQAGVWAIVSGSGGVWTVQQLVYAGLKQWYPTAVGAAPKPAPATAQKAGQ